MFNYTFLKLFNIFYFKHDKCWDLKFSIHYGVKNNFPNTLFMLGTSRSQTKYFLSFILGNFSKCFQYEYV